VLPNPRGTHPQVLVWSSAWPALAISACRQRVRAQR